MDDEHCRAHIDLAFLSFFSYSSMLLLFFCILDCNFFSPRHKGSLTPAPGMCCVMLCLRVGFV